MAFPDTRLDIRVQLFILGVWLDMGPQQGITDDFFTDVFTDVFLGRLVWDIRRLPDQDISISQGRADESSTVGPGRCSLILWNNDGYLTPDDPRSPWWSESPGGWGLNTPLRILVDGDEVFNGEVSEIHPVWPEGDPSVTLTDDELFDLGSVDPNRIAFGYVAITASGILRRLAQRTKPLRSPLTRLAQYNASFSGRVYGYWPFEDGSDATSIASGLDSVTARARIAGFSLASDSSLPGSDPLPKLSKGSTGSWSTGIFDGSALEGHWCIDWFGSFSEPPVGSSSRQRLLEVQSTGTCHLWTVDLIYSGGSDALLLRGFTDPSDPPVVFAQLPNPDSFYGRMLQLQFSVTGSTWNLAWSEVGSDFFTQFGDDTAGTAGFPVWAGGTFIDSAGDVVVGHVMARSTATAMPIGWAIPADQGWIGEAAGVRIARLCSEIDVPHTIDAASGTTLLGIQHSGDFLGLLQEAAEADGGILSEYRTTGLGIRYRPRRSLYNRTPAWEIDAKADGFQNPFEPVRDDQQIRNDVKVERIGGSSFQRVDQASVDKYGTYDESVSLSLDTDRKGRLKNQAGWRLHFGTHEGTRYPQVTVQLESAQDVAANVASWKGIRVGSLIRVSNLPPQHPQWPDHVDLVVEGWLETLSPFGWSTTINCSPAEPWLVARYEVSRYWPRNSRLATAVDADDTALLVAADGFGWSTNDASVPFDVVVGGAEVATVSDVSGPPPSQTFTVTRNVNLLGRAHPAGASVVPADPSILGL